MLEMLRNAWKVKELRNKMIYTVLMLLVYRVGAILPVPGVNVQAIGDAISGNGVLELFNMFNGGALANFTIFATGVTPYITASIVMQLLTVAIPKLEQLSKEGEEGRRKINKITRYVGIAMAFVTSIGTMIGFGSTILNHPVWYNYLFIAVIHTAGTAFTIWLGDRISSKGIGNGISLLIFINIISSIPTQIGSIARNMSEGVISYWLIPVFIVVVGAIIVAVVFVDLGERRITVQYAKRVVGRKLYGGQSTHIPLKVNNTGVMPLIFAMTIMQFPALIMMFCRRWLSFSSPTSTRPSPLTRWTSPRTSSRTAASSRAFAPASRPANTSPVSATGLPCSRPSSWPCWHWFPPF